MDGCSLVATDLACRRGDRLLFRGLSLSLEGGGALEVTGPNGTGKSSLIRILAGLLRPYAGAVERSGAIALLNEHLALDEYQPLSRALAFWGAVDGIAEPADRLGLSDLLDVPVRYLSTGQRKRAALARLIGQRAPIWLLDEPLNGLDTDAAETCRSLVADHCGGGGIALVASHQPFALPGGKLAIGDFAP